MKEREALKLALEAAEGIVKSDWRKWQELASPDEFERWVKSRALHMATAIKEVLAQPEQEPRAWINWSALTGEPRLGWECESELASEPLYTTPPQRKPLDEREREWIVATCPTPRHIIKAVEAAHHIKEAA